MTGTQEELKRDFDTAYALGVEAAKNPSADVQFPAFCDTQTRKDIFIRGWIEQRETMAEEAAKAAQ